MDTAAMAILWPTSDGSAWTLSQRSAVGNAQPQLSSIPTSLTPTPNFAVIPSLSGNFSSAAGSYTTVSFLRSLVYFSDQTLFPFTSTQYLNLTQALVPTPIIFARSSVRPSTMDSAAVLTQHDKGAFGGTNIDLGTFFMANVTGSVPAIVNTASQITRYEKLIFWHGQFGSLVGLLD